MGPYRVRYSIAHLTKCDSGGDILAAIVPSGEIFKGFSKPTTFDKILDGGKVVGVRAA